MDSCEKIELDFDINVFDCYKVFKYKYKKSNFIRTKFLFAIMILPLISFFILVVKALDNYINKNIFIEYNLERKFFILIIISFLWIIFCFIVNIKNINKLAQQEAEKYMEGHLSYKNKVILTEDHMTIKSGNMYGRVYYKGLKDIIIYHDMIIVLIKPFKIVIIPISAFKNLESRKNFIDILSEKINKKSNN